MNEVDAILYRGKVICGVLLLVLLFFGVMVVYGPLIKPLSFSKEWYYFGSRLSFWLCLLLMMIYATRVEKQPLLMWKESRQPFSFYFYSFFGILAAIFFGLVVINLLLKLTHLSGTSTKLRQTVDLFRNSTPLLLFTCFTAGVVEEFAFRGYLMPRLQWLFKNKYVTIILSSLLFGVLHIGYGTVGQVIGPFYIGAIFATHYYLFRNIKILMFCHFAWDLQAILINIAYYKH